MEVTWQGVQGIMLQGDQLSLAQGPFLLGKPRIRISQVSLLSAFRRF